MNASLRTGLELRCKMKFFVMHGYKAATQAQFISEYYVCTSKVIWRRQKYIGHFSTLTYIHIFLVENKLFLLFDSEIFYL